MVPTRSSEPRGTRRRAAFLSTDSLEDFVCDDDVAIPAMNAAGWTVVTVSWRDPDIRWQDFDLVIVRSAWDYQSDPRAFLAVLDDIDASPARLANPLGAMRWNLDKRYLLQLADRGVPIVPTLSGHGLDEQRLVRLIEETGWRDLVIKPVVGANADHTYRLQELGTPAVRRAALSSHAGSAWLAQSFVPGIVEEGEFSLFFFAGEFSHSILKTPAEGDFRVQEEHGGRIRAVAAEDALRSAGERVMRALPPDLLYARVDMARGRDGQFLLMEVEIVEPSLYFRMDEGAPGRFAAAVERWLDSAS